MAQIRVKEIYGEYDPSIAFYQSFHYTLDDNWFEYWINVHQDGVIFCNDWKLETTITKEFFNLIMEDKEKRIEFMNDLIINIEDGTEKPYKSKCITTKDTNSFDKEKWLVKHKDEWINVSDNPYHFDNIEMVLVDFEPNDDIVTVFNYANKTMYTSTIERNIFEVDNKPYSINMFETCDDETISVYDFIL